MRHLTDSQLLDAALKRGIDVGDAKLLRQALTQKSAVSETPLESNERLEFLGDAILSQVIATYLYHRLPEHAEGALATARSLIVCRTALAAAARRLDITPLLWIGATEEAMGGRNRSSLIADAYEALVAVIAICRGWEASRDFILETLAPEIDAVHLMTDWRDPKTTLQEMCQATGQAIPEYRIVHEYGRPHDRTFTAEVRLTGGRTGTGRGKTKKEAQQAAAQALLDELESTPAPTWA